jgi:hypothetical protein
MNTISPAKEYKNPQARLTPKLTQLITSTRLLDAPDLIKIDLRVVSLHVGAIVGYAS